MRLFGLRGRLVGYRRSVKSATLRALGVQVDNACTDNSHN